MTKQEADKEAQGGRKMTDLDELRALHEKWLIGTCDDAEMAQEAVMETHFLALIERVEKAERENDNLRDFIRGAARNMIKAIEPHPNSRGWRDD